MIKLHRSVSTIIKKVINRLRSVFFPSIQDVQLRQWYRDDGNHTKNLEHQLDQDSIVIDLGGYDGQWSSDIFSRYLCSIYVFEAVPAFSEKIQHRFVANPKIKSFPLAGGKDNRIDKIFLDDVGSSLIKKNAKSVDVEVVDVAQIFKICNISHCNLLKINIEGGEYEVLPRLISSGLINEIDTLQIQFHNFSSDSLARMNEIQTELRKTHELIWQYQWIWEKWQKKA